MPRLDGALRGPNSLTLRARAVFQSLSGPALGSELLCCGTPFTRQPFRLPPELLDSLHRALHLGIFTRSFAPGEFGLPCRARYRLWS